MVPGGGANCPLVLILNKLLVFIDAQNRKDAGIAVSTHVLHTRDFRPSDPPADLLPALRAAIAFDVPHLVCGHRFAGTLHGKNILENAQTFRIILPKTANAGPAGCGRTSLAQETARPFPILPDISVLISSASPPQGSR